MINDFNYVSPESEGIDSKDILEFLSFVERLNINIYSLLGLWDDLVKWQFISK